jgi:hypothetical protein
VTTKVRIEGVTIETTGELERELLERAMQYLASRHSVTIVTPLSPEEVEAVREALKEDSGPNPQVANERRDIDSAIEDFARRHAEADRKAEQTIGRPRQYPRVGVDGQRIDGPRSGATIGEMLAANGQASGNWMMRYKAHYWCPSCGNEGTRHIYPDWAFLRCHNCDARLKVEPATADGNPDEWGNYFVARELWVQSSQSADGGDHGGQAERAEAGEDLGQAVDGPEESRSELQGAAL